MSVTGRPKFVARCTRPVKKKRPARTRGLSPPVQSPPGFFVVDQQAARALPQYRFATAKMVDGKVELTFAIPEETPVTSRKTKTELVTQAYTVYVPSTVDCDSIVTLRAETRSRQVKVIKRVRVPKGKKVTRNYTVFVPYPYQLADGREETRARMETRTRTVPAGEPEIDYVPCFVTQSFSRSQVKCMDTRGKRLTHAQVEEILTQPRPAIFLNDDSWITPYFSKLLDQQTVLIMKKSTRAIRKKK